MSPDPIVEYLNVFENALTSFRSSPVFLKYTCSVFNVWKKLSVTALYPKGRLRARNNYLYHSYSE